MHSDEFCALLWLVASAHLRLALGQHMGLAFYKIVQKHPDLAGLASYAVPFTFLFPLPVLHRCGLPHICHRFIFGESLLPAGVPLQPTTCKGNGNLLADICILLQAVMNFSR